MPKSKSRIRKCQWCEKEYELGIDSSQHKYCSEKCRQQWHYNKWRSNGGHRDPLKLREYQLKHNYGITIKEFDEIFESQGSCCAICKSTEPIGKNWHLDHCHKSLKNRAILCCSCNQAIGLVKEDINILLLMIKYLEKHKTDEHKILPVLKVKYELIDKSSGQTWKARTLRDLALSGPIGRHGLSQILKNKNSRNAIKYELKIHE